MSEHHAYGHAVDTDPLSNTSSSQRSSLSVVSDSTAAAFFAAAGVVAALGATELAKELGTSSTP